MNLLHGHLAKSAKGGFSTLEILLAMTILVLTVTSVTLASFGSQSMQTDSETSTEALHAAQDGLEYMQTLARKDFQLVTPTSSLATIGAVTYHKSISISTTSLPDFATKQITSTVTWTGENNRAEHVTLSALVTNFDHAIGGNTCDSVAAGDWTQPHIVNAVTSFSQLVGTSTGVNVITSVDAYKGRLYLTVNSSQYKTDPRLYIFDTALLKTNPTAALIGKLATASNTATYGMYAVQVAEGPQGRRYAYVADDYPANWNTCTAYHNCAQLSIIDVTTPSTTMALASSTYYKLPNITGALNSGGAGNSIFYKDGLVYLGLSKTLSGPEFSIIDVHNPQAPVLVSGSGINLDFDVNAIQVVGNTAYLATGNDAGEVVVIDVTNPAAPVVLSTYDAPGGGGFGYGRSLSLVGDRLYLGRSYINGNAEFLALDASSSTGIIPSTPLGSRDIGTTTNPLTVFNVLVRGSLAFLSGGSSSGAAKFYVENISNLANITDFAPALFLPNSASNGTSFAMDCEGNDIYVSSRDASSLGYLSVINSAP